MKINNINNQNFKGAYIIKGSAKSIMEFQNELTLQAFVSRKGAEIMTHPLTTLFSPTQPYAEILICTGEHLKNIKTHLLIQKAEELARLNKFKKDFQSWSKEKQEKWKEGINAAIAEIQEGNIDTSAPGENALRNGNPDTFLNWYTEAIKNSNNMYSKISNYGIPFPAKIKRFDAKEVRDGLICNNFNLKEGFFRCKNKPNVEIDEEANQTHRYINGKLDSIVTQKTEEIPFFNQKVDLLETYTKLIYDKAGKLKESIKYNLGDFFDGITYTKTKF